MRLTVNNVTKHLEVVGIKGQMVRGNGYYYFTGPDFEKCKTTMVTTNSINSYSLEEWIEIAKRFQTEHRDNRRDAIEKNVELVKNINISQMDTVSADEYDRLNVEQIKISMTDEEIADQTIDNKIVDAEEQLIICVACQEALATTKDDLDNDVCGACAEIIADGPFGGEHTFPE